MSINSLNTIKDTIYTIMVKYPVTRDSDELLYLKVCEHYNPTVLNNLLSRFLLTGFSTEFHLSKLSADAEQKYSLSMKNCTAHLK